MTEKWTREEVADKVDWEGGVSEAIAGYGISFTILPEEAPAEVVAAWQRIEAGKQDIDTINDWLYGE